MAEVDFAVLSDYSFLDAGGKLCVIGIFDRIYVPAVPAAQQQTSLVVRIRGEANEKLKLRVEIVRPTGGGLAKLDGDVVLSPYGLGQMQLRLVGLPLPDYGAYPVNLYLNDALAFKVLLLVERPPAGGPN